MSPQEMVSLVKSTGSPQKAAEAIASSGMKVPMPNGQQVDIYQFAQMVQGKSPEQVANEMGIDSSVLKYLR
jgi:hypothetical protein